MRAPTTSEPAKATLWVRAVRFLGSYGLAVVIMLLLFVLTWLGTLEQRHQSIYDVQKQFFESYLFIYDIRLSDNIALPVPLVGANLLLCVLAVNLIVGGILRIRKSLATAGIIVGHVGILLLLAGSFVEFVASDKGYMKVVEGEREGTFQSFFDWEVVITEYPEGGGAREHVIPHDVFANLERGESARATSDRLPFDVVLTDFMRNSWPYRVAAADGRGEERVGLDRRAPDPEKAERNVAAVTVQLVPESGPRAEALLWGAQEHPARVEVAGRPWDLDLRHKTWDLPFEITLDKFEVEHHYGTTMPKRYSSFVTKTQDAESTKVHITMNEPLRHQGYTLYQTSFGREDESDPRYYSTFAVVRNPSDRVPWVAWSILLIGLTFTFVLKLVRHVGAQRRRHA